MASKKKNNKKKKRKINKKRVLVFVVFFLFFLFLIYKIFNINIKNIYICGNEFFTDQEIIDIAKLQNYPNSINNLTYTIKQRLEKNDYILSAKVSKRKLISKVYIEVKENYPLFYYQVEDKTVLYDGKKITDKFSTPIVINHIPNTIYDKFIEKIKKINKNILNRMSEIEYSPNDVDEERFLILMNDGNYVYINLRKFISINKYVDMVKSFENKKGILYLDSGEYFDIFDE